MIYTVSWDRYDPQYNTSSSIKIVYNAAAPETRRRELLR